VAKAISTWGRQSRCARDEGKGKTRKKYAAFCKKTEKTKNEKAIYYHSRGTTKTKTTTMAAAAAAAVPGTRTKCWGARNARPP